MVAIRFMPSKNSVIDILCLPMNKPESLKVIAITIVVGIDIL